MPAGVMPVSLLMWFLVYHHRVAPLRVLALLFILGQPLPSSLLKSAMLAIKSPMSDDWSPEETDDPLHADRRNFYKVEKWSRDGRKAGCGVSGDAFSPI
jgi:hypothetical protein